MSKFTCDGSRRAGIAALSMWTLAVGLACLGAAEAGTWQYASTSGFSSLARDTPTAFDFRGTNDLTIERTSDIGNAVTVGTRSVTLAQTVGAESNPDWVLGTRSYFQVAYDSDDAQNPVGTVAYEFQFDGGLSTSSKLVFLDFDFSEQVLIKAYDAQNSPIAFADMSILLSPGRESSPRYQDVDWSASAGATGLLANTNNNSESDIVASLSSTRSIYRLVYEFDLDGVGTGRNSVRFNFSAPISAVPGAGLAGLAGLGLAGIARRRHARPSSPSTNLAKEARTMRCSAASHTHPKGGVQMTRSNPTPPTSVAPFGRHPEPRSARSEAAGARLTAYASLAAAATPGLMLAGQAGATIYSGTENATLTGTGPLTTIGITNGTTSFNLKAIGSTSYVSIWGNNLRFKGFEQYSSSASGNTAWSGGVPVDAGATWNNTGRSSADWKGTAVSLGTTMGFGNVNFGSTNNDGFNDDPANLGNTGKTWYLLFNHTTSNTYGWMSFTANMDGAISDRSITITGWGWDDSGSTIAAGASAVPGGAGLAALAFGAAGLRGRRRGRD